MSQTNLANPMALTPHHIVATEPMLLSLSMTSASAGTEGTHQNVMKTTTPYQKEWWHYLLDGTTMVHGAGDWSKLQPAMGGPSGQGGGQV